MCEKNSVYIACVMGYFQSWVWTAQLQRMESVHKAITIQHQFDTSFCLQHSETATVPGGWGVENYSTPQLCWGRTA